MTKHLPFGRCTEPQKSTKIQGTIRDLCAESTEMFLIINALLYDIDMTTKSQISTLLKLMFNYIQKILMITEGESICSIELNTYRITPSSM